MYKKDGMVYTDSAIRGMYPNVSFAPSTYEELGFEPYSENIQENPEATKKRLTYAVQRFMDEAARTAGYDNLISACSYAGAPNPYQAEGTSFLTWRASVWQTCYTILAAVQAGTASIPTEDELIAQLPSRT